MAEKAGGAFPVYSRSRHGYDEIMAVAARKRYTVQDFFRFPSDGLRHEIVAGDWIVTPPPGLNHQNRSGPSLHPRAVCRREAVR